MPPMASAPTILVFDFGVGGLTVFREAVKARPDARFVYAADDAFFPYARRDELALVVRVLDVMEQLIAAHRPGLVVIACNTASTIVLPHLRERFPVPFVGTVPAIKPACSSSNSKLVSVLGTEATVKREYTRKLALEHANGCAVTLVGSPRLGRTRRSRTQRRNRQRHGYRRRNRRPASSNPAANAPIRSCWPARTTRCCLSACKSLRIGRSISSTLPPRSPAASSTCSAPRFPVLRLSRGGTASPRAGSPPRRSPRRSPVSGSLKPRPQVFDTPGKSP